MQQGFSTWLGATDNEIEGTFVWEHSGQPMSWTYWDKWQPDNVAGGQNCLSFWSTDKWNDAECNLSDFTYSMCEMLFDC